MEYLLFAGYLILFAWLITKIKFFSQSGLTNSQLVILFLLKVMAGIFYGWIGVYYGEMAQMIDTWAYHQESLQEYELLLSNPAEFFFSSFRSHYDNGYAQFLSTENSWWNDIKGLFLIKLMALFNVFSFGHYYTNVIFYCFITLFGPIALYRVMTQVYPGRKLAVLLATFLIPSFLYWTSGLHKEGLIFTGLALIIYHVYFGLKESSWPVGRVLTILLGLCLVLILRNFLLIILLPPMIAWILAHKLRFPAWMSFLVIGIVFIALFFLSSYIYPPLNLPEAVAARQHEFLKLEGGSSVQVRPLESSFTSFLQNAPGAFSLSILRPYPSDVHHLLSLAAALEINFLILFFLAFLVWRIKGPGFTPFLLFCLFFSFALLMMIGYSVNILGAIVRYRSVILPMLVVPIAAGMDWSKLNRLIFNNIKNNNNT